MSPEQCRGEPLDRRSDVFSVGIMLWELTLGRRLYRGKSDYDVLKQIVEGPVTPPREIEPDLDPALELVVMRALEKDRARRPQTARELQGELEAVARAARLPVSSLALQQLMERCFGSKIQVLRDAEAQGNVELLSLIVDQGLGSEELDEVAPSSTAQVAAPDEEASTQIAVRGAMRTIVEAAPIAARRTSWLVAAAVVVAAGAAGGAAALIADRASPARTATPPRSAPPPMAAPSVAAPPPSAPLPAPTGRPAPTQRPHHAPPAATNKSERPEPRPQPSEHGSGTLVLASSPWCHVAVDGSDRGPTPLRLALPAGPHEVELTNAEFHITRRLTIHIRAGETLRKSLDFGE